MSSGMSGVGTNTYGTAGQAKSVMEATLVAVQKEKAQAEQPLKVPDARVMYNLAKNGNGLDIRL